MKFAKIALAATALTLTSWTAHAIDISGAGATFPYPVYAKWADAYKKETGNGLNYQSIGSGGGIKQIKAKTVTFGATDAPLPGKELDEAGLAQFPMVMGGIVPVVNLDGIKPGELTIDGDTLAKIFLGDIKKWNDPAIAKLNPKSKLPDQAITVVHRADGSGTTFIFTDYLNEVSAAWKEKVGKGAAVKWPAATSVGGKGNDTMDGGSGYDEVGFSNDEAGVTVRLGGWVGTTGSLPTGYAGSAIDGWGDIDVFKNIDGVEGSGFNDTITGDANNNRLDGRGGADTIDGGDGVDWVEYNQAMVGISVDLSQGKALGKR